MNDIAKRKMTLPLVIAMARASAAQASIVRSAYARPAPLPPDEVQRVREVVDALAAQDDVDRFIATERERALSALARTDLREPARTEVIRLVAESTGAPSPSRAARA